MDEMTFQKDGEVVTKKEKNGAMNVFSVSTACSLWHATHFQWRSVGCERADTAPDDRRGLENIINRKRQTGSLAILEINCVYGRAHTSCSVLAITKIIPPTACRITLLVFA